MKRLVALVAIAAGVLGPATASATTPPTAPSLSGASRDALRAFADAMNDPSLDHEDVFAPGSPAHTFYRGYATLRTFGDPEVYVSNAEYRVVMDGLVDDTSGNQLLDVLVDAEERIVDATRNRIPLSASVYPIDVEHESNDARATVLSVGYLNSVLQVVTVIENGSDADAYVTVDAVTIDGQEFTNEFATAAGPGETVANIDVFADVPDTGGRAHAQIVIGGAVAGDGEFEFEVPAMGSPYPRPRASSLPAEAMTLADPAKKDIAMQLVSSAENSSLDWRAQYAYIEDIGDGRGYTAGIIGFCSGTGDMLEVVVGYTELNPDNDLAPFLPALEQVNGTASHEGLDPGFTDAWQAAADDPAFQQAQDDERDRVYFDPAVQQGIDDGVGVLGQFIYYDALVMHGDGDEPSSFGAIRDEAMSVAPPPSDGGDETAYLRAFLDARRAVMLLEEAHEDTSRIDTAQLVFLDAGNLNLDPPLDWMVYGDSYHIGPDDDGTE